MRTRTKQNKKRGTIFIRRKSSESYSKGRDSISCCQRGRYEYGRKNRRRKGKQKSKHFPTIQWVHGANLWGRKEGRNGVQKLPKRQDELIAFSFLKNKKQTERKNLDAFPHFFFPTEEQWPEPNPWPNFCSRTKGQCRDYTGGHRLAALW
jgi:hypothetical protein